MRGHLPFHIRSSDESIQSDIKNTETAKNKILYIGCIECNERERERNREIEREIE